MIYGLVFVFGVFFGNFRLIYWLKKMLYLLFNLLLNILKLFSKILFKIYSFNVLKNFQKNNNFFRFKLLIEK